MTSDERTKAVAWAEARVELGHHVRCNSRVGKPCDCYFRAGQYAAARLLLLLTAAEEPQP